MKPLYPIIASLLVLPVLLCTSQQLVAQQWQKIGPTGGDVRALTLDPATGIVYASGNYRIYRLFPGDTVWSPTESIEFQIPSQAISRFVPTPNGVFAIAGCCTLLFSSDRGETWETHYESTQGTLLSPTYLKDSLYLYASGLLYTSYDNGYTWNRSDSIPFLGSSLYTNGQDLYMTASDGLYRKEENGT